MAQVWNFPTYYATKAAYTVSGYDADFFYQAGGGASDWNDVGDFTAIFAILLSPGFCQSGQNQSTSGINNAYTPLFSIADYNSGHDPEYMVRTHYTHSTNTYGLQFFMYNGTSYQSVLTMDHDDLDSVLGYGWEDGVMLQIALSVQQSTGKQLLYVNGTEIVNNTVTPWASSMGVHGGGDACAAFNFYANRTSYTTTHQGGPCIWGPCLIDDAFVDLSSASVRANIYDSNGDFVWAGQDGSEWIGYQPWYFSETGVPYHGNKGTNSGTWIRPTGTSTSTWGYPCGTKWDWPTEAPSFLTEAKAMPGLKGYWHMYSFFDPQQYFLTNPITQNGHVRRYTSVGPTPGRPQRADECGSAKFFEAYTAPTGYVQSQTTLQDLIANVTNCWMTVCLDLTNEPTGSWGFQKVIGWRSNSSTSTFGVYTDYPAENGRRLTLQMYGSDNVARYLSFIVADNVKVYPVTWMFNAGVVKVISGASTVQINTDYSATFTALRATTGLFGFMDNTSAASGNWETSLSFAAMGTGSTVTEQDVFDLHAALLLNATG